jgi:excisionase family DNA binding protein
MQKKERADLKDRLFDIREAAEFLNVSEMTIRRWTNSGALKCYRVGGKRERRFRMEDLEEFLQGLQSDRLKPLGVGGHRVPDGSHMTHFYSGDEEALGVSTPFVIEGLRHGEVVLVVMPPARQRELMAKLEGQGRSIDRDLQKGRLNFSSGMDSPKEMIRYLAEFAQRAGKFRVAGDMVWALGKGWDLAALGALEEAAEFMPRSESGLFLCQYSLTDFSGVHIMMAAELHKQMIYKGRMEKSPYYRQISQAVGSARGLSS